MNKFSFYVSLGLLAVVGAASADEFIFGTESIGSCTEARLGDHPYEYLVDLHSPKASDNFMPGASARNDRHASLTLGLDPISHKFVIQGEISHGGVGYSDGVYPAKPLQYIGASTDWSGSLERRGPGEYSSNDGVSLKLTEKPAVRPLDGDVVVMPSMGSATYTARFKLADGDEIRMNCELSKEALAKIDRSERPHDLAKSWLGSKIEDNFGNKSAPKSTELQNSVNTKVGSQTVVF